MLQVLAYRSAGYDIEETAFDMASYQTHRIGLQVVAYLIFLGGYIQYVHIDHRDGDVLVTDGAYELFRYDSFIFQIAAYHVADCAK